MAPPHQQFSQSVRAQTKQSVSEEIRQILGSKLTDWRVGIVSQQTSHKVNIRLSDVDNIPPQDVQRPVGLPVLLEPLEVRRVSDQSRGGEKPVLGREAEHHRDLAPLVRLQELPGGGGEEGAPAEGVCDREPRAGVGQTEVGLDVLVLLEHEELVLELLDGDGLETPEDGVLVLVLTPEAGGQPVRVVARVAAHVEVRGEDGPTLEDGSTEESPGVGRHEVIVDAHGASAVTE